MNDAAPAVADATPVAEPPAPVENATNDVTQETTQPIKTTPEPAKVEVVEPKKKTARDSLEAASKEINKAETAKAAEVKKTEAVPKEVAKPAVKEVAPKLDAEGKPVIEAKPHTEAPKWLNDPKAKEKWATVDEDIKVAVHNRMTETEKGIEKYRQDATEYSELKEFKDLAAQYNTTLKEAMSNYVAIDKALNSNDPRAKLEAIEEVLRVAKVTPQDYAAFISKQPANETAAQANQTINELKQEIHQLKQQVQGVSTNIKSQQSEQEMAQLNDWAKDKPYALQLADQIAYHYNHSGLNLDEAYAKAVSDAQEFAVSMGFAPPAPQPAITEPGARTPNTQKSITGAPSPGSYPVTQKPSNSIKEAVARAFAQV